MKHFNSTNNSQRKLPPSKSRHPIRIVILMQSLCYGGAENQTIQLINKIDSNRFHIYHLYLDSIHDLQHKIDKDNIVFSKCLNRQGKFDLKVVLKLKCILEKNRIEIVYCVNEYSLLYAFLAIQFLNIKYRSCQIYKLIVSIHHSSLLTTPWETLKNTIYRFMINQSDLVVFVSKKQLEKWVTDYHVRNKIAVAIHNSVDTAYFDLTRSSDIIAQTRNSFGFLENDFVVGMCAVLRPEKNSKLFIWALYKCRLLGRRIKGLIIGDGPERAVIESYAESLGIAQHIAISGFCSDVRPLISCCNCLVSTSHSVEAHSIAALEAMSMGKTMIMSDIGGASETITHGQTGFLFNILEPYVLVDHLCTLIDDPELNNKVGSKAKKLVCDAFSLENMINAYETIFDVRSV